MQSPFLQPVLRGQKYCVNSSACRASRRIPHTRNQLTHLFCGTTKLCAQRNGYFAFASQVKNPRLLCKRMQSTATSPDKTRLKYLMIATYISMGIGGCMLLAIVFRTYGQFKKRARGIEDIDEPLYGRRSNVLCRYRGYVIFSSIIDTVVNDIPWFKVRSDDIWVLSFPKAGTYV